MPLNPLAQPLHPAIAAGARIVVGRVVSVQAGVPTLELDDGRRVEVTLAMAYGYRANVGDVLLVISDGERHYALGLLSGTGDVTLELPGDVSIRAEGELELSGADGVEIHGPSVRLTADVLRVVAGTVKQTTDRLVQRVRGLLSVHSAEKREVVEGEHAVRADRATLLSESAVTINGKEIHLG